MKLHLPNRLRKALLACLAAIAVPAFTSTMATGSVVLAGFCSFSALYAAEAQAAPKVPGKWNNVGLRNEEDALNGFDATKGITKNDETGNWEFGESSSTNTGKMFFVWEPTDTGYTLKFFNNETEKNSWVNSNPNYTGDVYSITYQNTFGSGNGGTRYGLDMRTDPGLGLQLSGGGSDIIINGPTAHPSGAWHVTASQNEITGVFYGKSGGTTINSTNFSGIDSATGGEAGAAISLKTGVTVKNITADFINNSLTTKDNHAAAIYLDYGTTVDTINGNFIGNYIEHDSKIVGGAILNWGKITTLQGTFIGNHLEAKSTQTPVGGVIANGAESITRADYKSEDAGNKYSVIEHINGYFIGNYATATEKDTIGGTIANYGRIGDITGVFIGNFAYSKNTANSGVVRNYSRNTGTPPNNVDQRVAVIGISDEEWNKLDDAGKRAQLSKTVISGIFIGNYAQGVKGDGYGGVMRNNGEIRGAIDGLFVGNYAITEGEKITGGATPVVGNYDYIYTGSTPRQNRAMAYGGVIYNEIKIVSDGVGDGEKEVMAGDIKGLFFDNYVNSKYGEAFGGAIFNQDATIQNISGAFSGNHAVSSYYVARGGAIYDNKETRSALISKIGESATNPSTFSNNYAKAKMAQGGAVYVSLGAKVGDIYADFLGNYSLSGVKDDENQYYAADIQQRQKNSNVADNLLASLVENGLHPTAQGGALYVANKAETDNITGRFIGNFARTTGIGYSDVAQTNERHWAQGGAVFVDNEGQVKAITGDFEDNYVETLGLIHVDGITARAQGGAIYLNAGTMENITGNFQRNEAAVYSSGDEKQEVSGGAIYVASGSTMNTISGASISYNKAVSAALDARKDTREKFTEKTGLTANTNLDSVTVQGGALYVDAADVDDILVKSIGYNEALSKASGYKTETVQGGAIYVNTSGTIKNVGREGDKGTSAIYASISHNKVEADGNGSNLTMQEAQGGAIYVSNAGSIDDIYADFTYNAILAQLADSEQESVTKSNLTDRIAQGGAIYLNESATIGNVRAAEAGFDHNSIRMTGDKSGNSTKVLVQGGAIYVNEYANAKDIVAHLTNNSAESSVTGAASEKVGGGAIYVADQGYIGNIGHKKDDSKKDDGYYLADINDNSVTANGKGTNLTEQWARGGAILVAAQGSEGYSIDNIYTSGIERNSVTSHLDDEKNENLKDRRALGGAIYVASGGSISDIGAYTVEDGYVQLGKAASFSENTVLVDGGHADNTVKLQAQGGALYVDGESDDGNITTVGNVVANFIGNEVNTTGATGNSEENVQGGAIYVNNGGHIGNIGRNDDDPRGLALVRIDDNALKAGGEGNHLTTQAVQGGAIYVSKSPTGSTSLGSIYASSISGNTIEAGAGDSTELNARDIQGGAIYMFEEADAGDIGKKGIIAQISKNTITVTDGNARNSIALTTGGGAIFAGREAQMGSIYASFTENGIDTTGADGNGTESLQGGAIYLRGGAEIADIGSDGARVEVRGNYLNAGGKGDNLTAQTVQGGAFYLGANPLNNLFGTMGNVYADFVGNTITADAGGSSMLSERTIQGGAIYLADGSKITSITEAGEVVEQGQVQQQLSTKQIAKILIENILNPVPVTEPSDSPKEHGFLDNSITVTGGEDGGEARLIAQGGALYLAGGASVGNVQASFIRNTITTKGDEENGTEDANGNSIERVAGGAIYVAGGGEMGHIGSDAPDDTGIVSIKGNGIKATGHGSMLEKQWARGGAIFVGEDSGDAGKISDIYANITDNSINISADEWDNDKLKERLAMGGALFVADKGEIGSIYQSKDGEGITRNSITVSGGNQSNETTLEAKGGAFYLEDGAQANGVMASFTSNKIDTSTANGNLTETVGGGAIYLAKESALDSIGKDGESVKISYNSLHAGGQGENLTEQTVQGGAIYASSKPSPKANSAEDTFSIKDIHADIVGNTIIADVGISKNVTTRTIQGGAIYLADNGAIGDIEEGNGIKEEIEDGDKTIEITKQGISYNTITVTEGGSSGNTILTVQGGALYVASNSKVGKIMAHFNENKIVSNGQSNSKSLAQGGAIYVSGKGEIDTIGAADKLVEFKNNSVSIGENAVSNGRKLTEEEAAAGDLKATEHYSKKWAQGGAIYVASDEEGNAGKVDDVHAHFEGNSVYLAEGTSNYVDARAYGGAVFVSEGGELGSISGDFVKNTAKSAEQSGEGSQELVHGGAIDVAFRGQAKEITGNFRENGVENSEATPVGNVLDENYGEDMHAKGGAIYLAEEGHIDKIGNHDSEFLKNYAKGSGQVRGGAILVKNASVGEIAGTFIGNYANGTESLATYGGGIRFDDSVLIRLESDFYSNHTTGLGGALSLTKDGIIYEVTGDFKGNYSAINGGAVEDLGRIGLRGYAVLEDGEKMLKNDYSNVKRREDDNKLLKTQRDSTDTTNEDYKNLLGRAEYDGSFTGGFVNSNFLYNRVYDRELQGHVNTENSEYFRGAGIYTNQDLFITVNDRKEVIMSGNAIERGSGDNVEKVRSAIYVDNHNYEAQEGDYKSLVIYMVAQEDGVLRIDDNIRGHEKSTTGLVVRLRGYTDKVYDREGNYHAEGLGTTAYDKTGLIILNNRVERTYTVMDDVTLYIGYKARTFDDAVYLGNSKYNIQEGKDYKAYLIGDEGDDIVMKGSEGELLTSEYLNHAGVAYKTNQEDKLVEVDGGRAKLYHQSDVFRDSFFETRSGVVALTETTYATKKGNGRYTDMTGKKEEKEAFTEYLFGGFVAYGADYNYGKYGTDSDDVKKNYASSSMTKAGEYGEKDYAKYAYRMGSEDGRYASFEFGMDLSAKKQYTLELANRYYYKDRNGNPTEIATHLNEKTGVEEPHEFYEDSNGNKVRVKHQMAKSDVLTVFAVWDSDNDDLMWTDADGGKSSVSRGRVTLNGLTVVKEDAWKDTKASVNGPQWDKDGNPVTTGAGYNRDLYVQLINYRLVDKDGKALDPTSEEGAAIYEKFYAKFYEEDDGTLDNGYHLTRLSDHFDLVHNAEWFMKGSDILAEEIELATTVTKDDSIRIVGWRDHLAEWAEHEASWDGEKKKQATDENGDLVSNEDGTARMVAAETDGLYTGKKHFLLDQNVYYLNRDINLPTNPTDDNHDGVGAQMWGKDLTIEGVATNKELNLQRHNMLSLVIEDQAVRLQNFTLVNVQEKKKDSGRGYMQNEGDLTFDTMRMETSLIVNNAGNEKGKDHTLENQLTVTGVMDIDFTITTEKVNGKQQHGKLVINNTSRVWEQNLENRPDSNHQEMEETETPEQPGTDDPTLGGDDPTLAGGSENNTDDPLEPGDNAGDNAGLDQIVSNEEVAEVSLTSGSATTTYSGDGATGTTPDAPENPAPTDKVIGETVVHITGVVEHQNITHQGEDKMVMKQEEKVYNGGVVKNPVTDNDDTKKELDTWYIETGKVGKDDIRETFTTNTYLDTTKSDHKSATEQFLNFRDNALHMEGGAFNLGDMYTHRLVLRYFYVSGGAVFVNHSLIDMENEVMGGIDVSNVGNNTGKINNSNGDADYIANKDTKLTPSETAASSGTGDGLIWLQGFTLKGTARNNKTILHVKFVDDGVGDAVKDGMGIANGSTKNSGGRIMPDGDYMYNWLVTYNDEEAENDKDPYYKGKVGIRGMYTFRRLGPTPELLPGPVTDLTGSYVSMMQVYNYSFEHSELFSPNMNAAREQQLYSDHYSAVDVKGKNCPVVLADSCPPSTVGLRRGLWLRTYASAEKMPLRNGPEVNLNMYGGLIGGDTALQEHRSGWASVWSFYGGYLGSTQSYDGVRIRQNGAAIGATGTFYKKRFYTAVTASVGMAQAAATGRAGSEDFGLFMGGIASRSGYSFDLDDGNYVLQPNLQISYTLFNNLGYTNASGHSVSGKPTGVLQVHPFLKLIKNSDCTWKPYGKVGVVYNAFGKTSFTADGVSMPAMSIRPYVEYSIGAQRTYNDRYTVYGELTGRNGGRNGGEASIGIRRAW